MENRFVFKTIKKPDDVAEIPESFNRDVFTRNGKARSAMVSERKNILEHSSSNSETAQRQYKFSNICPRTWVCRCAGVILRRCGFHLGTEMHIQHQEMCLGEEWSGKNVDKQMVLDILYV